MGGAGGAGGVKLMVRAGGMEEGWTVDLAISKLEVGVGVGWRRVGGLNQRHVRSEEETCWDGGGQGQGGGLGEELREEVPGWRTKRNTPPD